MSAAPPPPAFGTTVALAQQALTRRLHAVLAELDIEPARYYALRVVARQGAVTSAALDDQLAQAPVSADSASEAPAALVADRLLALDGDTVALTPAGAEALGGLSERLGALTRELLGPLDPEDVAVTIRTLQEATARADAATSPG